MKLIRKFRRESFGGIIFSEHPGFTAFINNQYADKLHIPRSDNLPAHCLSVPLDAHLSLTTRCNLHCQGCYTLDASRPGLDMDFTLARAIVDNLAQLNVFTVALGGGEPFLYPHLFELAHYLRRCQIVPNITTNGTLINETTAPQCRVFGNIHLSLHKMGELERLEQAIGYLQAEGIMPGLNLLMTSETVGHLEAIFAWAARVKIGKILLLKFKLTPQNQGYEWMQISAEQERNLFPRLKKLARKLGIVPMIDCSLFPSVAVNFREKDLRFYDVNGCQGGNMYMAIEIDGRYKPCSFWEATFGDAHRLTADEWTHSPQLNEFRRRQVNPTCEQCCYISLCNTGCRLMGSSICHAA